MPNTLSLGNWRNVLQRVGTNRYLSDGNGNPLFMQGDAGWSMISQLTNAQIDTYLADRAARGFNFIIAELIEHMFCTNAPNNIDNVAPFTGAVFTTPNDTYFQRADYAISKAASYNITILLAPLYLGIGLGSEGWGAEVIAASTADMTSWGQYVGNRFRNYDNLIWVIGGDTDPTTVLTKVNAFVNGVLSKDRRHLITFHNNPGSIASDNLGGATWLTLGNFYTNTIETTTYAETAYNDAAALPYFQIESFYENEHSMTATGLRSEAYWSALGGGFGHMFGNNPIWKFAYNTGGDWQSYLDDEGSVSMTYYGQLFRSRAWYSLVPDWSHVVLTSGYGTQGAEDYVTAARIADGSLVMAYMPSNRTMTFDMTKLRGTTTARWYDPTNGTYIADAASPLANTGTHNFSRATTNSTGGADWVLVLEA